MSKAKKMMFAMELADAHAEYMKKLLTVHNIAPWVIKQILFHYKTAFIHGFKHAITDPIGE